MPSLPDASSDFLQNVKLCSEQLNQPLNTFRKFLSRADKTSISADNRQALIFDILTGETQSSPPIAALRAIEDGLQSNASDYWLCADPVHLHPDLDYLLLFAGDAFYPTPGQAKRFIKELNQLFAEDEIEFVMGSYQRWYMRCKHRPDAGFSHLENVLGKNILPFMPTGVEQKTWRRYLNEIQMQMTASDVNQQRDESGLAEINSVWCWGGGTLPDESLASSFTHVYSEEPFSKGLAKHLGVVASTVPDALVTEMTVDGEQLFEFPVADDMDDPFVVTQFLHKFEHDYLIELYSYMKKGALDELVIYFSGQVYTINNKTMRRWWRRTQPLSALIS